MLCLCPRSVTPPLSFRLHRLYYHTHNQSLRSPPACARRNVTAVASAAAVDGMDVDGPSSESAPSSRGFQVMVAVTKSLGIGVDNGLPWKSIPGDMAYFKQLTTETRDPKKRNAVVMGRKTWESIPAKFRPLAERLNVVLSRTMDGKIADDVGNNDENSCNNRDADVSNGVLVCRSLGSSLVVLGREPYLSEIEHVFVIGGSQVFNEALAMNECEAVHLTKVDVDFECDAFLPPIDSNRFRTWAASEPKFDEKAKPQPVHYSFQTLTNTCTDSPPVLPPAIACQHEEQQYLDMISNIIDTGVARGDRTGTGTVSKFGTQMRFNLRNTFPLLTTKRVFWKGVVEELLWFVSGSTNGNLLSEKGVKIWEGNGSRQFLDSVGLQHREEGDLGPVYGFQWRHFGAKYVDMHTDYTGQGVDQLAEVIRKIKETPNDRRIIMSAWNPADLGLMALPPCHMFCQFYVANGEVSCQMYQRSCDMGLGVPFNIASYALLTCIVAHVCDLKPGDFVHTLGDAHVYSNHVEPLKRQLLNSPMPFPVLELNPNVKDIDSFSSGDIVLNGYKSHKKIAMEMAV